MADVLTELVAKITADASGLKAGLSQADKSIGSFVSKNTAGLRSLGVAFTALGAAIVGGLGASTKAAIDFESAFTGVRKTVEGTDAEFATLRQGIRDLAKVLPLPAVEIAAIAQSAGQLGVKTPDIMKFTEVITKLGMATDLASQDAAVMLAKFTNVMRMDISNMDRLAAVIVDLGNNMATNEPEIVAMASRLSGAAAVVGMTEANVMALAAALSSLGVEAQMGGTAVQRVLLEMNTAVIGGGDALKGFADIAGMATSEFATAFKDDAASALITFVTGLKAAMDSGLDVTSMLKELGLADMRVLQVLLKSAGGLDKLTEAQLIANDAWVEKIALDIEVAKRLEDTKSKMEILKNVLIDVGITIGDFFVPILKDLVDGIMPIIKGVQTWIEENPGLAKTIAITALAVGGLMLVLGPLLIILPGIISLLGIFGITLSAAIWPVTLVVAVIAVLSAGIIGLISNWDKLMGRTKKVAVAHDEVADSANASAEAVNVSAESMAEAQKIADDYVDSLGDITKGTQEVADSVDEMIKKFHFSYTAAGAAGITMKDLYNVMIRAGWSTEQITKAYEKFGDEIGNVTEAIKYMSLTEEGAISLVRKREAQREAKLAPKEREGPESAKWRQQIDDVNTQYRSGDISEERYNKVLQAAVEGYQGSLLKYHSGGIVPGTPGQEVPILAQAGEIITPASAANGASSGVNVVVNVGGSVMSDYDLAQVIRNQLINIKYSNVTSGL